MPIAGKPAVIAYSILKLRTLLYCLKINDYDTHFMILPRDLPDDLKLNALYFRKNAANNANDAYYLGNISLAVGTPDTRNKLLTEGKFVTHGILFDVNSDQIKPSSYGALKDIAQVLIENESLKVLIVGHTNTDGEPAANLELSKKRAEAVKTFISKEFNIVSDRLQTDGKGETHL